MSFTPQKNPKKKRNRVMIDLDPDLQKEIVHLSLEIGVPQSQLVNLFCLDGIEDLEQGKINLDEIKISSRSPKFRWNLDLNERLKRLRDKKH